MTSILFEKSSNGERKFTVNGWGNYMNLKENDVICRNLSVGTYSTILIEHKRIENNNV